MRPKLPVAALLLGLAVALAGCTSDEPEPSGGDDDGTTGGGAPDDGMGDEPGPDDGNSGGNDTMPPEEPPEGNQTQGNETAGNDTEMPEPPAPVQLSVDSSGQYPVNPGFDPATLTVEAGAPVTLTFNNVDDLPLVQHNWVLEGVEEAATDIISNGESATVEFTAPMEPGEYPYFCSVGDHRDRGMEGVLTVTGDAAEEPAEG